MIASIVEASVTEMDESPSESIPSSQPQPKSEDSSSVTVGIIAGVAAVAALLAIAFAVGISVAGRESAIDIRHPLVLSASGRMKATKGDTSKVPQRPP